MGRSEDQHDKLTVVHCIDDAVVADSQPQEVWMADQCLDSWQSWFGGEPVDRRNYSTPNDTVKLS